MKHRFYSCLAILVGLFIYLQPSSTSAQVLKGTFAAGFSHSLSIHADGTLWTTGHNTYGQLGDGTTTNRTTWVQVGTATNWTQVTAGDGFSLALRTDGSLWAWGNNYHGVLATPTGTNTNTITYSTPQPIAGTWAQVAAGGRCVLALKADGSLWAWGSNTYGQLGNATGNGTNAVFPTPVQLAGTYTQVAAGFLHCLALSATGTLYSWGCNKAGTLGYSLHSDTYDPNPIPTAVVGTTYTQLAAGLNHSLALRADGTLWAWGYNDYGQLGRAAGAGGRVPDPVPQQVPGTYLRVAVGADHSLALRADGSLWAWGSNTYGQLGTVPNSGSPTPTFVPTQVPGTYVQVAAGANHSLGLQASGQLLTWGMNFYGQLGNGSTTGITTPNPTPATTGTALPTRSTAAGTGISLAVRADGTLWTWGTNSTGLLGSSTIPDRIRPGQVGSDHDWVQVVVGTTYALALKANGTVWAWGSNTDGELGQGTTASVATLVQVPLPTPVVQLAAGGFHSLALTASGQVYSWGLNVHGQTGEPGTSHTYTPTALSSSLPFTQVAGGSWFSVASTANGQVYAWGANSSGQLGTAINLGTNTPNPVPMLVMGLPAVRQLAVGGFHSLALTATGQVYAWGNNVSGQLGTVTSSGTTMPVITPIALVGLPLATQLAASGGSQSLALTAAGTIYTWGYNGCGELGQGAATNGVNPQPMQEATSSNAWATLGTGQGYGHTLVRTASGLHFASAGCNSNGQLGDGTTTAWPRFDRMSPLASLQPLPVLAAVGVAFSLYPNPARAQATAGGLPVGTTLVVYDALGRLVMITGSLSFSVAELPAGLYVVHATTPGQLAHTARLLVE